MINVTTPNNEDEHVLTVPVLIALNTFIFLTSSFGSLANLLTMFTIVKSKSLRNSLNLSLVSLALADFIVCIAVLPIRFILYNDVNTQIAESFTCKLEVFFTTVCDVVQPAMLVATSFERYKSIAKPFANKGKERRTMGTIIATWIVAVLMGGISCVFVGDVAIVYPCYTHSKVTDLMLLDYREIVMTFPMGAICICCVVLFYWMMIRTLTNHAKVMDSKRTLGPIRKRNKIKPLQPEVSKHISKQITDSKKGQELDNSTKSSLVYNLPLQNQPCSSIEIITKGETEIFTPSCDFGTKSIKTNPKLSENSHISSENIYNVASSSENNKFLAQMNKSLDKTQKKSFLGANNVADADICDAIEPKFIQIQNDIEDIVNASLTEEKYDKPSELIMVGEIEKSYTRTFIECECHAENNSYSLSSNGNSSGVNIARKCSIRGAKTSIFYKQNGVDGNTEDVISKNKDKCDCKCDKHHEESGLDPEQYFQNSRNSEFAVVNVRNKNSSVGIHSDYSKIKEPTHMGDSIDCSHYHTVALNCDNTVKTKQTSNSNMQENNKNFTINKTKNIGDETIDVKGKKADLETDCTKINYSDNINSGNVLPHKREYFENKTNNVTDDVDVKNVQTHEDIVKSDTFATSDVMSNIIENQANNVTDGSDAGNDQSRENKVKYETLATSGEHSIRIENKGIKNQVSAAIDGGDGRDQTGVDVVDMDGTVHKGINVEGEACGAICVMNNTNRLQGRRKFEMRAAKRIAILIGSFVFLWLPLPLTVICMSGDKKITSSSIQVVLIMASISTTTAVVNPLLNLLLNKQIRSATMAILRSKGNAIIKRLR